ncbi:MAG TPA: alpha/beta hydrolase, partial [bacterium]
HSLGGAVSLALALNHPEAVGGLALIAPLTHPREEPAAVFKPLMIGSPLLRWLVAWTLATPMSIRRAKASLAMVFGPEAVPTDYRLAAGGLLSLRPRSFIAASTDIMAVNLDLPAMVQRYGTLQVPLGILFARGDRLLDYRDNGEAMVTKVRDLQLTVVEGGHMLPVTQPAESARLIREQAKRMG